MFATQLVVAIIFSYFIANKTMFLLSHPLSQFTAISSSPVTLYPHSNPFGVDQNSYMFFPRCILILSLLSFIQLNAQLHCSRKMLTLTLKIYIKMLLHVSV